MDIKDFNNTNRGFDINLAERNLRKKEEEIVYTFSDKTKEMLSKYKIEEDKTENNGNMRAEKKIGAARKKRGSGRGCE